MDGHDRRHRRNTHVWGKHVFEACPSSLEGHRTTEENDEDHVRKQSCEVHHLSQDRLG